MFLNDLYLKRLGDTVPSIHLALYLEYLLISFDLSLSQSFDDFKLLFDPLLLIALQWQSVLLNVALKVDGGMFNVIINCFGSCGAPPCEVVS